MADIFADDISMCISLNILMTPVIKMFNESKVCHNSDVSATKMSLKSSSSICDKLTIINTFLATPYRHLHLCQYIMS